MTIDFSNLLSFFRGATRSTAPVATHPANEIKSTFFTSKRFLLLIAVLVLFCIGMLAGDHPILRLVELWMITECVTQTATIVGNVFIKCAEISKSVAAESIANAATPLAPLQDSPLEVLKAITDLTEHGPVSLNLSSPVNILAARLAARAAASLPTTAVSLPVPAAPSPEGSAPGPLTPNPRNPGGP